MHLLWMILIVLYNSPVIIEATAICGGNSKRSIIAQNHFYIMGGGYTSPTDDSPPISRSALYWLDLDSQFPVEGSLTDDFLHNTSYHGFADPQTGIFWTDKNETNLYVVGNMNPHDAPRSEVQTYNIQNDSWQSTNVTGGEHNVYDRTGSMHASSSDGGESLSFVAGGKYGGPLGMVIFNSSDSDKPSWTNSTKPDIPFFSGSTTQYLRFGTAGVLISIGGWNEQSLNQTRNPRGMDNITVYNIANDEWSTVTAQGEIPPPRLSSCSAVSAAPDDSSFQILMYGGIDAQNATLNDTYVLSLPAFRWIQVPNITNQNTTHNVSMGRQAASCASYKDRQMLVVGGRSTSNATTNHCEPDYPYIRLLDTTTFEWQTQYPLKNSTYEVPKIVTNVIGGGGTGGARPASAWQDTLGDKVDLFSKILPKYIPPIQAARPSPNSTATAPYTRSDSRSGTRTHVIIGAVLGSVGVPLVAAATTYLFIIKRRQSHRQKEATEADHQPWYKAELSSGQTSRPWAKVWQIGRAEAEESNPRDVLPKEMEAVCRSELPAIYPEEVFHELDAGRDAEDSGTAVMVENSTSTRPQDESHVVDD